MSALDRAVRTVAAMPGGRMALKSILLLTWGEGREFAEVRFANTIAVIRYYCREFSKRPR